MKIVRPTLAALIVATLAFSLVKSQVRLENWKTLTSLMETTDGAVDSKGRLWAISPGGAFVYDFADQSVEKYGMNEGLPSSNITAVEYCEQTEEVFLASADGFISAIDADGNIRVASDINSYDPPNPKVNDIMFRDGRGYAAGEFGLTVFDPVELVFIETPPRLGDFPSGDPVNQLIVWQDRIWAACNEGLASAPFGETIVDPNLWTNYGLDEGLPSGEIVRIVAEGNEFYAAKENIVYHYDGDMFERFEEFAEWQIIVDMDFFGGELYLTHKFAVVKLIENSVYFQPEPFRSFFNGTFFSSELGSLVFFTEKDGLAYVPGPPTELTDGDLEFVSPNSPKVNKFIDVDCDPQGNVWCSTDKYPNSEGFMKFDPGTGIWTNFDVDDFPDIVVNDYYRVNALPGGTIVFSSWNNGVLFVEESESGYDFKHYNYENSPLEPYLASSDITIGGEAAEENGVIWVVDYVTSGSGPILVGFDAGSDQTYSIDPPFLTEKANKAIAIDFFGTKWLGSIKDQGLIYYNDNRTYDDYSDDDYGRLTTFDYAGLPDNSINCIAVDKDGVVWIGTNAGIAQLLNPASVLSGSTPIFREIELGEGSSGVNDIVVDALNYKWVATTKGVWALDPFGEPIAEFTPDNSPLVAENVYSIAYDAGSGKIYFGTGSGLCEATSLAVEPLPEYEISCYPQPYAPTKSPDLVIEGLAAESDVRILTINGQLVRKIQAFGRKAVWDGRDETGEFAPTGIYLVSATSLATGEKSVAKIAVTAEP